MKRSFIFIGIKAFVKSKEENVQLDIFRQNGEVLLQIYKQKDAINWNLGVELDDINGYVAELYFNKGKTNNENNFIQFQKSSLFEEFKRPKNSNEQYYYEISSTLSKRDIENVILHILNSAYNLENEEVFIRVSKFN